MPDQRSPSALQELFGSREFLGGIARAARCAAYTARSQFGAFFDILWTNANHFHINRTLSTNHFRLGATLRIAELWEAAHLSEIIRLLG